jgi:hypothetical protein
VSPQGVVHGSPVGATAPELIIGVPQIFKAAKKSGKTLFICAYSNHNALKSADTTTRRMFLMESKKNK